MRVQSAYGANFIAANGTFLLTGDNIGFFLAHTTGTITLTEANGQVKISGFPVNAGTTYSLPIVLNGIGAVFTCALGASGTLGT